VKSTAASSAAPRTRLTEAGQYWLLSALLLGVVGWWKSISLVILLAYLMAALLLLNGWLARRQTRRVQATPLPTAPVCAGEEATIRLQVRNCSSRPATATVATRVGETLATWLVVQLPPRGETVCSTRLMQPIRGIYPVPPVRVRSGFPLGLVAHDRPTGADSVYVVLPAVGFIDTAGLRRWLTLQSGGDGRIRKVVRRVTTDQADTRGVRPYRPGDSLRTVHWRSTARRGELMVREYDTAPSPDLLLVVEPWLPSNPTPVQRGNLEAALSLATTLALHWLKTFGTRVTVAVAGDATSIRSTTANEASLRQALVPLAGLTGSPTSAAPPSPELGRWATRGTRLLVSSRSASPYAALLSRTLGRPFLCVAPTDHPPWYHPAGLVQTEPTTATAS
jgi:uncharacterized protein (DUF58 family)